MGFVAAAVGIACVDSFPIDGRVCPCASGYQCCAQRCLPAGVPCAASATDGGADDAEVAVDAKTELGDGREDADGTGADAQPADAVDDSAGDTAEATDADAQPERSTSWGTVAGFPSDLVVTFDLRLGTDGLPVVALSRLMPGNGRSRAISVYRQTAGGAFAQLGGDLQGPPFPILFALAPDDTPYVANASGILRFDAAAQSWNPLPALPDPLALPLASTALGVDGAGRPHAVAQTTDDRSFRVVRWSGTGWDLLGLPGSLGLARSSPLFAWDASGPYLALGDADNIHTNLYRLLGADWQALGAGGLVAPSAGAVPMVAADGTAYLANAQPGALVVDQLDKGHQTPWQALDGILTPYNVTPAAPSGEIAADGRLYLGFLGNRGSGADIVPGPMVVRRDGDRWTILPLAGLDPSVVDGIRLRVGAGADPVLYLGYLRSNQLSVKRFPEK